MSFLFLQKDFDFLKNEQDKLLKRYQKIGQDLRKACEQSSETWHDNAPYDDALYDAKLTEDWLQKIGKILEKVQIINLPIEPFRETKVGNLIKVIDENEKEKFYELGSYIIFDENKQNKNYQQVSYSSPLGTCLLNKKVGENCNLKINEKEKIFKILEIK